MLLEPQNAFGVDGSPRSAPQRLINDTINKNYTVEASDSLALSISSARWSCMYREPRQPHPPLGEVITQVNGKSL